jgi:hypothetical protein
VGRLNIAGIGILSLFLKIEDRMALPEPRQKQAKLTHESVKSRFTNGKPGFEMISGGIGVEDNEFVGYSDG